MVVLRVFLLLVFVLACAPSATTMPTPVAATAVTPEVAVVDEVKPTVTAAPTTTVSAGELTVDDYLMSVGGHRVAVETPTPVVNSPSPMPSAGDLLLKDAAGFWRLSRDGKRERIAEKDYESFRRDTTQVPGGRFSLSLDESGRKIRHHGQSTGTVAHAEVTFWPFSAPPAVDRLGHYAVVIQNGQSLLLFEVWDESHHQEQIFPVKEIKGSSAALFNLGRFLAVDWDTFPNVDDLFVLVQWTSGQRQLQRLTPAARHRGEGPQDHGSFPPQVFGDCSEPWRNFLNVCMMRHNKFMPKALVPVPQTEGTLEFSVVW